MAIDLISKLEDQIKECEVADDEYSLHNVNKALDTLSEIRDGVMFIDHAKDLIDSAQKDIDKLI
jgi:hypothetical protein